MRETERLVAGVGRGARMSMMKTAPKPAAPAAPGAAAAGVAAPGLAAASPPTRKGSRSSTKGGPSSKVYSTERSQIQLSTDEWNSLLTQEWYHGMMPREEIEELLTKDGDFLVRKSDVNNKVLLPLSVRSGGRIRHFIVKCDKGLWWITDRKTKKKSLDELLKHYTTTHTPIQAGGPVLKQFVPRPSYYMLHEQVELKQKLGEGAFGEVYNGKLREYGIEMDCAVKTLKGVMAKQKRVDFIREARLMRKFSHGNIVRVYGVAAQKEPIMIILELSPGGSLKSHLQKKTAQEVPVPKLSKYCHDAAEGMCYMSSQRVIHRDIAARNCLLGHRNEVKISDFGLSVELPPGVNELRADENIKVPVRWLAPETIKKQEFSFKTDVWSYGVLMWEIFARCSSDPYPSMGVDQVLRMVTGTSGILEAPKEMPGLQEALMRLCFIRQPEERPTFAEILVMSGGEGAHNGANAPAPVN